MGGWDFWVRREESGPVGSWTAAEAIMVRSWIIGICERDEDELNDSDMPHSAAQAGLYIHEAGNSNAFVRLARHLAGCTVNHKHRQR